MDEEVEDENSEMFVRRGSLLTTHEKQLAESRAQLLKLSEEMQRVKAEAEKSKKEAQELREHLIETSTKTPNVKLRPVALGLCAALMLGIIGKVSYDAYRRPPAAPLVVSAPVMPPMTDRPVVAAAARQNPNPKLGKSARAGVDVQFSQAIQRLQTDFDSLPGEEADIVREINQHQLGGRRPCPLQWNHGSVSISLDGKTGGVSSSMVNALNQCADAAESLMAARAAALEAEEAKEH
jgi:hypothetical protein